MTGHVKTQILELPLFCLGILWLETEHVKIISTETMKAGLWDAASLLFGCLASDADVGWYWARKSFK